jgi:hypothetical protein
VSCFRVGIASKRPARAGPDLAIVAGFGPRRRGRRAQLWATPPAHAPGTTNTHAGVAECGGVREQITLVNARVMELDRFGLIAVFCDWAAGSEVQVLHRGGRIHGIGVVGQQAVHSRC